MELRKFMKKIGIIGSGSWAFALSKILKKNLLFIKSRDKKKLKHNFDESKTIRIVEKFTALNECKYIFFAIPSQSLRQNLISLKKIKNFSKTEFIICCKGVEKKTNKLMSEVLCEYFPKNNFAILSGPNFSFEVIKGLPTASTLSSKKRDLCLEIANLIYQEKFRTYFNTDIIGTQVGGAMKNVIAIACGLVIGKKLGNNASAAIITRGLSEIIELGTKMGAKKNTFYGLSGIGDLNLSCSSLKSRNTKLGYYLGKNIPLDEVKKRGILTEGLYSCDSICSLGKKYNVELPICNAVKKIINGFDVEKIVYNLLSRPLQFEK